MEGLAHGAASVMLYVCALKIKEAISFSLEKKDHIYLTWMLAWRRNWRAAVTSRSTCAGFIVTTVITGASWLGLQSGESVTVHNCSCWKGALHVMNVRRMELR